MFHVRSNSPASCPLVRLTPCSVKELSPTGRTPPTRTGAGGCSTSTKGSGPPGWTRGGWRPCWWPSAITSTPPSQVSPERHPLLYKLPIFIIPGVQVCVRGKEDRVEVWLGNTADMREVAAVGRKIKMQLGQGLAKMEFSIHNEEKEGFKGPCLMI